MEALNFALSHQMVHMPFNLSSCRTARLALSSLHLGASLSLEPFPVSYSLQHEVLNRKQPAQIQLEGLTGMQPNVENGRKAPIILLHSICCEAAWRLESG